MCEKLGDPPRGTTITEQLDKVCDKLISLKFDLEENFNQIDSDNEEIIEKVCSIKEAVKKGKSSTIEKTCEIEEEVGNACDGKGRTVQENIYKVKKQCQKNYKGIKKIYDRCSDDD